MPAPCLTLKHLKTSKQYEGADLIVRYWFEWQDRRDLATVLLGIDLLDADNQVLAQSRTKLPGVKITNYIPATETSPQKPVYDKTVWVMIDDVVRANMPVAFRYYVLTGLFKKSDMVTVPLDGKFDDISSNG